MFSQIRHALSCRTALYGPAEPSRCWAEVIGGGLLIVLAVFVFGWPVLNLIDRVSYGIECAKVECHE